MREKPSIVLSEEDVKHLIIAREIVKSYHEQSRIVKQSLDIKRISQVPYIINHSSAEAYIIRALYSSDKPLHFSQIVERIAELGWKSNSSYHKFAYLEKVLRDGYYLFKRVAPATFALRKAFTEPSISKTPPTKFSIPNKPIPTTQDVIRSIIRKYHPSSIYELFKMLSFIGYNISYATIKRFVLNNDVLHLPSKAN